MPRFFLAALLGAASFHLLAGAAFAQGEPRAKPATSQPTAASSTAKAAGPGDRASPLSNLGSSKEPIKIDADRLDVFDKEGRAVFTGNVVAVQGDTTMQCTVMSVFYEQGKAQGGGRAAPGQGDSSIKKIDCKGPVTVVSKTQTATGDRAEFDRALNKVVMSGNVALTDGANITRGERLVYDVNSGVANVETAPGGRVKALFVPGSGEAKPAEAKPADDRKAPERKAEPSRRSTAAN